MKENAYRTCVKFTSRFNRDELPVGALRKFTHYAVPKGYVMLPDEYQEVQKFTSRFNRDELPVGALRKFTYYAVPKGYVMLPDEYQAVQIEDIKTTVVGEQYKIVFVVHPELPAVRFTEIMGWTYITDTKRKIKRGEDNINKPSHYTQGGIEPYDYITANKMDFTEGGIIKYITRYKHKGKPLEDLKKARWYLDQLIKREENKCLKK